MKNRKALFITEAAMIAAVYVVLTVLINMANLAGGFIQLRISEALTILPIFTPAAIPGLFVGCILGNIFTGCMPWDVVFGSLATLIGAIGTYYLRKKTALAILPPIMANTLIVPLILKYVYNVPGILPFLFASIGISELVSVGIFGNLLICMLKPYRHILFR